MESILSFIIGMAIFMTVMWLFQPKGGYTFKRAAKKGKDFYEKSNDKVRLNR